MVNVFHPLPTAEASVAVLDDRRLGKQRVEARQIITALEAAARGERAGWQNHPAVRMYAGHVDYLKKYYNAAVAEWVRRGKKNAMPLYELAGDPPVPWFVPCRARQMADRAALFRKMPEWYADKFEVDPAFLPLGYCWTGALTSPQRAGLAAGRDDSPFHREVCAPISARAAGARRCPAALASGRQCANTAYAPETLCGVHRRAAGARSPLRGASLKAAKSKASPKRGSPGRASDGPAAR